MEITTLSDAQYQGYLALLDRHYDAEGASSRFRDDFPLLLDPANRNWMLGIVRDGQVAAGLSCLIRQYRTNCGILPVAGIGGVVTRDEFRGQGMSRQLMEALVARLAEVNVPLAVLWTNRPEIYRGRGFLPAGWEFHAELDENGEGAVVPPGFECRSYQASDEPRVSSLFSRHPYRALRHPGDAARLYGMPGTRGLVAVGENDMVSAAVFCGKGSDFKDYVTEWNGPRGLVLPLLHEARDRGWARRVLVPAGEEGLAAALAAEGAVVTSRFSGCWSVIQPESLSRYLQGKGMTAPRDCSVQAEVLGTVDKDGVVVPGTLSLAVWGFDSV